MIRIALVLALLASFPVERAHAVVCAKGVYRAGCAGPNGAVGVRRGYGYGAAAVARPVARPYGHACYWRAGVRVCR